MWWAHLSKTASVYGPSFTRITELCWTKIKIYESLFPMKTLFYKWLCGVHSKILFDPWFSFLGIILAVVFIRIKKDKGKDNVENAQATEVKPLRSWSGKGMVEFIHQVLFQWLNCFMSWFYFHATCVLEFFFNYSLLLFNILPFLDI